LKAPNLNPALMPNTIFRIIAACAVTLTAGCTPVKEQPTDTTKPAATAATATTPAAVPAPATTPALDTAKPAADAMRLEVDINARQLHVYKGATRVASHPVAVGSKEWPTQTGEWKVKQVVLNPEWVPPDESWADEREPRKPGDPKNPLGRAQLVYDAPRSIHGTNVPSSIGKAVSHGSIRMTNDVIVALAREVLAAGGAPKDDAWFQAAQANKTEKQIVDLPNPVPIRVF
jgi:lipoprotein-anchoring transpeptidase ErfK/SrfK